jgi:CrcB-like protein
MSLVDILIVGVGSSFGGMTRFILSKLVQTGTGGAFPWGTLTVNLLGCLAIGIIYGALDRGCALSHGIRLFLTVGFCGGFTTFSTFIHESHIMFGNGGGGMLAAYIILSIVGGLLLTYIGYALVKLVI